MPSLKAIKNRIKTTKSTQKITKAMKMVSAAKLRRMQDKLHAAAPYAVEIANTVKALSSSVNSGQSNVTSLLQQDPDQITQLLIVVTADRGLCGPLNSNVLKLVIKNVETLLENGKKVLIYCIGKRGYEDLKRRFPNYVLAHKSFAGNSSADFHLAYSVAHEINNMFVAGSFGACTIYYTHSKSTINQIPTAEIIIPLCNQAAVDIQPESNNYECEPNRQAMLDVILLDALATKINYCLLSSLVSEHSSRMTAMENATNNSSKMIKNLNLVYNRTRQAHITKELIEIISGAEAV